MTDQAACLPDIAAMCRTPAPQVRIDVATTEVFSSRILTNSPEEQPEVECVHLDGLTGCRSGSSGRHAKAGHAASRAALVVGSFVGLHGGRPLGAGMCAPLMNPCPIASSCSTSTNPVRLLGVVSFCSAINP